MSLSEPTMTLDEAVEHLERRAAACDSTVRVYREGHDKSRDAAKDAIAIRAVLASIARSERVAALQQAGEPVRADAATEQETQDCKDWLSRLLDGVVNANRRAEQVAMLAYREFGK